MAELDALLTNSAARATEAIDLAEQVEGKITEADGRFDDIHGRIQSARGNITEASSNLIEKVRSGVEEHERETEELLENMGNLRERMSSIEGELRNLLQQARANLDSVGEVSQAVADRIAASVEQAEQTLRDLNEGVVQSDSRVQTQTAASLAGMQELNTRVTTNTNRMTERVAALENHVTGTVIPASETAFRQFTERGDGKLADARIKMDEAGRTLQTEARRTLDELEGHVNRYNSDLEARSQDMSGHIDSIAERHKVELADWQANCEQFKSEINDTGSRVEDKQRELQDNNNEEMA